MTEQGLFIKLVEEMGEVAEVLNIKTGRKASQIDSSKEYLAAELADMVHHTIAIGAINEIDFTQTILDKDKKALIKYGHETKLLEFIRHNH